MNGPQDQDWDGQSVVGHDLADRDPADHDPADRDPADHDPTVQLPAYRPPEDQPPPLSDLADAERAAAERVAAELAVAERDAVERAAAELAAAQHAAAARAYQQMAAQEAAAEQEAARRAAAQHTLHPGTPQPPYYPPPVIQELAPLPDRPRPYVRTDARPAYHPLPDPDQQAGPQVADIPTVTAAPIVTPPVVAPALSTPAVDAPAPDTRPAGPPAAGARAAAARPAATRPAAFQQTRPPATAGTSPAELLEFAVGNVLQEDASVDALPVILSRLTGLFSCRAALAFQENNQGEMIVLAAYPRQAGADKALRAAISRLATDHQEMTKAQGYFQAPLAPAITGSPASAATSPVNVMMATSTGPGGRSLCAIALIGDSRGWDASCRATTRALAAIIAAQIRHANDASEIAARRARVEAMTEAAPDAIVVADSEQGLTVFNKAAEELTGWNREEVLGRNITGALIPPDGRAGFTARLSEYQEHCASNQPSERVRINILRADGSERLVELTPVPMMVDDRAVFCAFLRDVGELDRAHSELRETEERFRLMSQLAPVGIIHSDINGICVFANDRWCELMGLTPQDAIGSGWDDHLEPDEAERIAQEWAKAARHDGELRIDVRLKPIGGQETWVHLAVIPVLDADGRAVGFLSAITNVSERKRAEAEREKLLNAEREARRKLADQTERLNGLVDSAIPGILFDDEAGNITQVNQSFCDLFGLPDQPGDLIGTPSWRIAVRIRGMFADPEGFIALARRLATEREQVPLDEIPCADGRTLEWDFAPVFVGGEYRGNLWGVGDVTDRAELNEQRERLLEAELAAREAAERAQLRLTEQNQRLQELDEAKTEFLATMSHELRTPLTSIVSFTDLILDDRGSLPPDTVSSLAVIQRNGERLLRLLGDLLLLSRLEARAVPADFMPVSVPDLIADAVRSISATAAESNVTVASNAADGPPVAGDQLRLMQVMDNLLSNAIKFSGRGGQIRVEATHDGQMWRIDVADDGIGIPADEVDQLFGRFMRATNARMAGLPGTGLGLSVVKGITELHGGRVEVHSVVELGTTFSVYLPVMAVLA